MTSIVMERRLGVGLTPRVGTDLRFALEMSNTTMDTEPETQFMDGFTTEDPYDGANYARQSIANEVAAVDLPNSRFEFNADPIVFTSLGVGTRQAVLLMMYLHVTNDADSLPDTRFEFTAFDGNGENVTFTGDSEGMIQAANA